MALTLAAKKRIYRLSLNKRYVKGKLVSKKTNTSYISLLEQQVDELKYSEKLQHALYKIASISHTYVALHELYRQIHLIVNEVINAKNFYIAIFDEDTQTIHFPYFVDEKDTGERDLTNFTMPLGEGLTSYVVRNRKPKLCSSKEVRRLVECGEVADVKGSFDFSCWLGAPMINGGTLHGVITVQSYEEGSNYTERDVRLLDFVANQIANALENNFNESQRREAQQRLAEQHRMLEQQNIELNQSIDALEKTQRELVQKEKMASLGGLVAGIAHEINTPLGICVTGASHLMEELKQITVAINDSSLTETQLTDFFEDLQQGLSIIFNNTQKATNLVKSFKQVAVDQSSNEVRQVNLSVYLDEIVMSLKPKLKRTQHSVKIDCPSSIQISLNAGALSQIISNMIMNSLIHGFEDKKKGRIQIKVQEKEYSVNIHYADDGRGMSPEALNMLFEPFYTTKRSEGGSGLGTHLIYNLVQSLSGKIKVKSELGKGLAYLVTIPKEISE